jgi:hypothetical protein
MQQKQFRAQFFMRKEEKNLAEEIFLEHFNFQLISKYYKLELIEFVYEQVQHNISDTSWHLLITIIQFFGTKNFRKIINDPEKLTRLNNLQMK